MPDTSTDRRPTVLLLAGDVRDDWTRALEAGGIDVATTGWLDGITAARLKRPDLLLVSTDLPEGAPQSVLSAFRSHELGPLPIVLAGPGADRLDQEVPGQARPDQVLPGTVDAGSLPERTREAIRVGRVRVIPPAAARIALGLAVIPVAAFIARVTLEALVYRGSAFPPALAWLLFAVFVLSLAAVVVIALKARTRPFSMAEKRSLLGQSGFFFWVTARLLPLLAGGNLVRAGGMSLAFLAWAAWAWLGPQAKPRTPRVRRAFQVLAAALALLAAAPWAALAWWGA